MPDATLQEELLVDIEIFWGDDAYVSYCPVLNVSSQGKTVAEAERNIIEALRAFVGSCHRRGTLDQVLEEAGLMVREPGAVKKRFMHPLALPALPDRQGSHANHASQI